MRNSILAAAAALLEKGGIGAVTMDAVAARSGAGKPTIYRYWPNREALAMAALMVPPMLPAPAQESHATALDGLRQQLLQVADVFSTPRGRNAVLMTASADAESELAKAFRNQVMLASREEGRVLLTRAAEEGTVRADLAIETALDMIYGPIFYRLLMGHAPVGAAFIQSLLDEAMRGIGKASSRRG